MMDGDPSNYCSSRDLLTEELPSVLSLDRSTNPPDVKRPRMSVNWDKCLCHGHSSTVGKLENFTQVSWDKFCNAAKRRQDDIHYKLQDYITGEKLLPRDVNKLKKHHNCYAVYVLEKSIILAQNKHEHKCEAIDADGKQVMTSTGSARLTRSSLPTIGKSKCIICQGEKRLKKDRRRVEPVHPLTLESAVETFREAAEKRGDAPVLLELGGGARGGTDAIAGDVMVHETCRGIYTNPRNIKCAQRKGSIDDVYDSVFEMLADEIEDRVINGFEVMQMNDAIQIFVDKLAENGIFQPQYRSEKLKKRLINRFGCRLSFWCPKFRRGSELIFSDEVPIGMVVEAGVAAMQSHNEEEIQGELKINENDIQEEMNTTREAYHISQLIRNEINDMDDMPWPPLPEHITTDAAQSCVPASLYNILAWIISDDASYTGQISLDKLVKVPRKVQPRILSIAQDIVYVARKGRIRTPKHVSLAASVHHLTGSMQLVEILNGFGHCISKSKLQEIETAITIRRLQQKNEHVVPSNIVPNVPVVFVWDNNDISEETSSGKNTTHCTNGIIIQPAVSFCKPRETPVPTQPHMPNMHARSVEPGEQLLLEYRCATRSGPSRVDEASDLLTSHNPNISREARLKDFGWFLARLSPDLSLPPLDYFQQIPGWSGFNCLVRNETAIPLPHSVGYLPVIDASPTSMNVVYTFMKQSINTSDVINCVQPEQVNKPAVIIVLDQAVYAKALEVRSSLHDANLQRIVLRMGAFHTINIFLAVIGRRFGSAGLRDILIEADILASGSVDAVLEGRHYNRGMRAHKIVAEAIERLRWAAFLEWNSSQDSPVDLAPLAALAEKIRGTIDNAAYMDMLESLHMDQVVDKYKQFCQLLGPNGVFWSTYLDMIKLLLLYVRSTREANWDLHLDSLQQMLPYLYAYDRTNYGRYVPAYLLEMLQLPDTHPEVHQQLTEGNFAVQRSTYNKFGRIPQDQTIEVTINRDTKTAGGIIGMSLQRRAVFKWMILRADRAEYLRQCHALTGQVRLQEHQYLHKDAGRKRVQDDEKSVHRVSDCVENWINPFKSDESLCHLASGRIAPDNLAEDLLHAHQKGVNALKQFAEQRLDSDGEMDFYAVIPKLQLQTFATLGKVTHITADSRQVVIKSTRELFGRLLVIGQTRSISLRELLTYPLGTLPLSIATPEGQPVRTVKATLLRLLETGLEPVVNIPHDAVRIYDAMAILHAVKTTDGMTYSQLARHLLCIIMRDVAVDGRIDWVVDIYRSISIKNAEHGRRNNAALGTLETRIRSGDQKVDKQFNKSLQSNYFKQELSQFFLKEWTEPTYTGLIQQRTVMVTAADKCFCLSVRDDSVRKVEVDELRCTHEEADTRMFLHALHAANSGSQTIIIRSPDTDVAVIGISVSHGIPAKMIMRTGTKLRARYIDLTSIAETLGEDVCAALPGYHAFTGCDTTSAFVGRGKAVGFKLLTSDPTFRNTMTTLGQEVTSSTDLLEAGEAAICNLYGHKGVNNVNQLRLNMFGSSTTDPCKLPPCKDAATKHILRANYQAAIWKRCLCVDPQIPSPHNQGWDVTDTEISIKWIDVPPAPQSVLNYISCKCGGNCNTNRCSCHKGQLRCTGVCGCQEGLCENGRDTPAASLDSDDDSEED